MCKWLADCSNYGSRKNPFDVGKVSDSLTARSGRVAHYIHYFVPILLNRAAKKRNIRRVFFSVELKKKLLKQIK